DDNFAYTNAGSGGVIGIAAAIARTTETNITKAWLDDGDASNHSTVNMGPGYSGDGIFEVKADHIAQFNAQVSTVGGGLLAGAGAEVTNDATLVVSAGVGQYDVVNARSLRITATNHVAKPALPGTPNIKGTTGGLVSGAGASDDTTL